MKKIMFLKNSYIIVNYVIIFSILFCLDFLPFYIGLRRGENLIGQESFY